jgi:propionyl-CoA carboxylase alpha chain/3-methylcrotonyl-CoA carboxylase alpha subunit
MPEGIRVDTGVEQGGEVSQFYDPMIAKLIVHEDTREAAAARLAEAAGEVEVWPVKTNAGFLKRCLDHPRFVAGDVDTGFIAAEEGALQPVHDEALDPAAVALFAEHNYESPYRTGNDWSSPWDDTHGAMGLRLNGPPRSVWAVTVGGRKVVSEALSTQTRDSTWRVGPYASPTLVQHVYSDAKTGGLLVGDRQFSYYNAGQGLVLFCGGDAVLVSAPEFRSGAASAVSDGSLRAPMPGKVVAAPVKAGHAVTKGQPVVVLEAMKMEHALTAPFDGVVESVAAVGDQVVEAAVLAVVKATD